MGCVAWMPQRGCGSRALTRPSRYRAALNAGPPMSTPTCLATETLSCAKITDVRLANSLSEFSMPKAKIQFLQKPTCTTCRKAKAYLEKLGADLELRSLDQQKLSKAELDELIGGRDHKQFLSSRNEIYRARKMKDHPPTRAEAIRLMAEARNCSRRPGVMRGKRIVRGYDEDSYKELVK